MLNPPSTPTRRDLLGMIGKAAGGAAMYQAMASLGFAADSGFAGSPQLSGAKPGASVLILGAGVAGLVAGLELRRAGYKVKVLEYTQRAGGRCFSVRGGDTIAEMGSPVQHCGFAPGEYFNPGPWRIPFHHHGLLHYCRQLGVALEPFMQVNYNAYVHNTRAYGGKPQRYRHVQADFQGNVAELLGKALNQGSLDAAVTREDKEVLLEAMKRWGALDANYHYAESVFTSDRRGYDVDAGGGLMPAAKPSKPLNPSELLQSGLWRNIAVGQIYEFQGTMMQPVGGMDMIAKAFAREVGSLIRYGSRVTRIAQDAKGVTVTFEDQSQGGAVQQEKADWCLCTIPLSILSQIDVQVGAPMQAAINAVPYGSSVKIGLQFKRRFWEQDEQIYGGITNTDLPIAQISYPSGRLGQPGPAVVLGAYRFEGPNSFEFAAMPPAQRIRHAVMQGKQIHEQYEREFDNGVSVAWYRMPGQLGCYGRWSDAAREQRYKNLCAVDGRIALAGEHASYLPAWQEGAVLSSLDAIGRLHARALAS